MNFPEIIKKIENNIQKEELSVLVSTDIAEELNKKRTIEEIEKSNERIKAKESFIGELKTILNFIKSPETMIAKDKLRLIDFLQKEKNTYTFLISSCLANHPGDCDVSLDQKHKEILNEIENLLRFLENEGN